MDVPEWSAVTESPDFAFLIEKFKFESLVVDCLSVQFAQIGKLIKHGKKNKISFETK